MSGYSNTAYQEHSEEVSAGHNASSLAHQQDLITPVILERATAHMNIQGTSAAGTNLSYPPVNLTVLKIQ